MYLHNFPVSVATKQRPNSAYETRRVQQWHAADIVLSPLSNHWCPFFITIFGDFAGCPSTHRQQSHIGSGVSITCLLIRIIFLLMSWAWEWMWKLYRQKKESQFSEFSVEESCCICCHPISIGKDEALFCSGACQKWLHRYCASVSECCYKAISDSSTLFICYGCYQECQQEHITELTNTVEDLNLEIARLRVPFSSPGSSQS